LPLNTDRLTKR